MPQLAGNATQPVPLPLDRWTVASREKGLTSIRLTSAGLALRTPRAAYASAVSYGPLIAPDTGRYRFALKYRSRSGHFVFGARPLDESIYLAQDSMGHPAGDDRDIAPESGAIADMNLNGAADIRHLAIHADVPPETGASRLK